MSDFVAGFCVGLFTWFSTWGFNRIYLLFKTMVS